MFLDTAFGRNLDIVHRTMDVNMMRQSVTADNIANADTPNFKRTEINFETELRDALESRDPNPFPAALTDEEHIPFHREVNYQTVTPRRVTDFWTETQNNGNNVDIEQETMNLVNSQLMYSLMTNSVSSQFRRLNLVMQ